jgi:glutathione synthase/RimK-type ligase-like ATP-grasp enzyme
MKPRFGKMGRGVFLADTAETWQAFLESEEAASTPFLAQEYMAASHGRDVRFFFARFDENQKDVIPVVVKRRGAGLASNAHAGGVMEPFTPPDFLYTQAKRMFVDSGLDYGTVDFMFADEGGSTFVLCETNACPGFEALENMSGLDVAKAILLSAMDTEGTS